MGFELAVWIEDTRPEGERTKSGRRKIPGTLAATEGGVLHALSDAYHRLEALPEEERGRIVKVRIRRTG